MKILETQCYKGESPCCQEGKHPSIQQGKQTRRILWSEFVSPLPRFIVKNLIPTVIALAIRCLWELTRSRWWGLHEGISAFIEEDPETILPLPPSKDTAKRHHLWTTKGALTRHQVYWSLDLGLLCLQNWKINLLFISYLMYGILL